MERSDRVTLTEAKREAWIREIDQVMTTVLPAAFAIADEKGVVSDDLLTASSLRQHGVAKLEAGDLEAADNLLVDAYNRMQSAAGHRRPATGMGRGAAPLPGLAGHRELDGGDRPHPPGRCERHRHRSQRGRCDLPRGGHPGRERAMAGRGADRCRPSIVPTW
jgi:hypothetical protein